MAQKANNAKSTSVNNAQQTTNGFSEQQPSKVPKFVVVRDGMRVSDKDYAQPNDPQAQSERVYWQNIANRWSHGERVQVVQYDSKRHRVW